MTTTEVTRYSWPMEKAWNRRTGLMPNSISSWLWYMQGYTMKNPARSRGRAPLNRLSAGSWRTAVKKHVIFAIRAVSQKTSHVWLAITLTYTIWLRQFLAEVLLRKQEIRRWFVFPPQLSSTSASPCERRNPEDSALVHCACTESNYCSTLDLLSPEPCSQQPELNALITRFRESYSSASMRRQSKRLKKSSSDWLNSDYALIQHLSECSFRLSSFCQVVQQYKLFEVA